MNNIGRILFEERKSQKKSIQDVQEGTKIRGEYIKALENEDFSKIPGSTYIIGFIKSYAEFLGLNAEELVTRYKMEYGTQTREEQELFANKEVPLPIPEESKYNRRNWIIAGALFLIIISFFIIRSCGSREKTSEIITPKKNTEVAVTTSSQTSQTTATVTTEATKSTANKTTTENTAAESNTIEITESYPGQGINLTVEVMSDKCWIQIEADGEKTFGQTLSQGEKKDFHANKKLYILAGKASVLKANINSKEVNLGSGVIEKTFQVRD